MRIRKVKFIPRKYDYSGITKERIAELENKGLRNKQIAKELGLSLDSYKRLKRELGIQKPQRTKPFDVERFEQLLSTGQYSREEIAELMGESLTAIQHNMAKFHKGERKPYPYKEWRMTDEQKSVLAGTLLGDSSLKKNRLGNHASLSFAHCAIQKELFDYKASVFKDMTSYNKPKKATPDKRTGKVYETYQFGTVCHPNFTEIHAHLYPNGKKVVSKEILEWFDARSLAVLLMDDGHNDGYTYNIATCAFTEEDLEKFQKFLEEKFGITTTVHGNNMLYVPAKSRDLFTNLVKPWVLPSMQYKLHHSPHKTCLKLENP